MRAVLGARPLDIVVLVLRQALWIVGAGVAVGIALALAGARLLSAFLYGISAYDAVTLVAVSGAVVIASAIACLVPARRAARIDPLAALQEG